MLKRMLKAILLFVPPFMRPALLKLYIVIPIFLKIPVIVLPRAVYLRLSNRHLPRKTESDLESIMHNIDHWVLKHSGVLNQGSTGYLPADFTYEMVPLNAGIQQVREEIYEFAQILLNRETKNRILEIGLGNNGGTHILWRYIFDTVVTVEIDL